jgi:hypothetical protein
LITSKDFSRIVYRDPKYSLKDKRGSISKIIGFDSEALTTGQPFMFATSLNEIILPMQLPDILFEERYIGANFMLFNIKYDSGAILYCLPREILHDLWQKGKVKFGSYRYRYIPHKQLRIFRGRDYVTFWDISQFYKHEGHRINLNTASKIYLDQMKLDMRTKRFRPEYVRRYWKAISRYCIQDAVLTARLGQYLVDKLEQFGITAAAIYSCASISFKYFADHSRIVTAYRFWEEERELLKFALDAYEGGKFEVTSRGKFSGYEYDLSSAYPYEIDRLVDISAATCLRTVEYQSRAVYGYLRCWIENPDGKHLPCGIMIGNVRIYPAGRYFLTITKGEYDYITSIGVKVKILDAYWLFVKRRRFPYRRPIGTLYNVKTHYKKSDKMLYDITKIVQNSFYGKTCQMIETWDGRVHAGIGWNPMYAAEITAGTRIKMAAMQNRYNGACLAVHTDSLLMTRPLPDDELTGGIGNFEFKAQGDGVIIACGMYQIGEKCAFKGFNPNAVKGREKDTWISILERNRNHSTLKYNVRRVESWVESMAKNHDKSAINVFGIASKVIDLNCDVKRVWLPDIKARNLLSQLEQSYPKILIQENPPDYWHL